MLTLRHLRRSPCVSCASRIRSTQPSRVATALVHFRGLEHSNWLGNASVAARTRTLHSSSHNDFRASATASAPQPYSSQSTKTATLTPKRQKQQMQWNVHREINVHHTPLPDVFARLCEEIRARGLSIRVRQAIDAFYFNCAQQVSQLPPEFVAQVVDFFERELLQPAKQRQAEQGHPLSESLNEGVFTAIVRLLLAQGDKKKAWETAQEPAVMCGGKLHFRSVGPILDFECRRDEFTSALERWRQLKMQEMEWTKTMEDTLVQMIIACHRYHCQDEDGAAKSGRADAEMTELLRDLSLATREISADNASRLRHAFQSTKYGVRTLPDNMSVTPQCGSCQVTLKKERLTDAERQKLVDFIENHVRLKNKNSVITTKEFLVPFKRWLLGKHTKAQRHDKLHYILDGPNIAYLNQNFDHGSFRFDHVDHVVQMLQREGHEVSITIPHSYLEETSRLYIRTRKAMDMRKKGKTTTRQRTPADKATIDRWRQDNLLFSCRTDHLSDDIFWLYATALLGEESRVVTNDQGRDHMFTLMNNRTSGMTTADLRDDKRISIDLLDRWRESVIVNIEIQHGDLTPEQKALVAKESANSSHGSAVLIPIENVRLIRPTPFSRVPQLSPGGQLHFPIADPKNEGATKWLCIHPAAADSAL